LVGTDGGVAAAALSNNEVSGAVVVIHTLLTYAAPTATECRWDAAQRHRILPLNLRHRNHRNAVVARR
jgi:hypothetical protein